jgi:hypothetical protein
MTPVALEAAEVLHHAEAAVVASKTETIVQEVTEASVEAVDSTEVDPCVDQAEVIVRRVAIAKDHTKTFAPINA